MENNKSGGYMMVTKKGYNFFEVSSAMQKSIRRGKEEDAFYWAWELYRSNFEKYVWKRLLIISCEDVGLADPEAIQLVNTLHDNYTKLKAMKTDERCQTTMGAELVLCRAKKSALFNWVFYMQDKHDDTLLEIPDYAIDIHTRRGKKLGRGIEKIGRAHV